MNNVFNDVFSRLEFLEKCKTLIHRPWTHWNSFSTDKKTEFCTSIFVYLVLFSSNGEGCQLLSVYMSIVIFIYASFDLFRGFEPFFVIILLKINGFSVSLAAARSSVSFLLSDVQTKTKCIDGQCTCCQWFCQRVRSIWRRRGGIPFARRF